MATAYRQSRNIEASIIEFIREQLTLASWNKINVEKTFVRVEDADLQKTGAFIVVRISDTIHNKVEIGDNNTYRTVLVLVDIFATSDGQRLDLKDFLAQKLKNGLKYYEYVINAGQIQTKTQNGRISVSDITDTIVNLGVDKDNLDVVDRYRHLLTLNVEMRKVEV